MKNRIIMMFDIVFDRVWDMLFNYYTRYVYLPYTKHISPILNKEYAYTGKELWIIILKFTALMLLVYYIGYSRIFGLLL